MKQNRPHFHHLDAIIDDRLYVGDLRAAMSKDVLEAHGITHVLSVCPENPVEKDKSDVATSQRHMNIPVQDSEYENILIHLSSACDFIDDALSEKCAQTQSDEAVGKENTAKPNKVLVHCVMGVSRSATVACAYLIRTRKMEALAAIQFVKQHRPQVSPNYGFVRQLQLFATCDAFINADGETISPTAHPAYVSWQRHRQADVRKFLNKLEDTIPIMSGQLYISSEFPTDPIEAHLLLSEFGITHVLSLSPAKLPTQVISAEGVVHHAITLRSTSSSGVELDLALPEAVKFIERALADADEMTILTEDDELKLNTVLVHSQMESRATTVVCAYLMKAKRIPASMAFSRYIENAVPLFSPSQSFLRHLDVYETCGYRPTPEKLTAAGLGPVPPELWKAKQPHTTVIAPPRTAPASSRLPFSALAADYKLLSSHSPSSFSSEASSSGTPSSYGAPSTSVTTPDLLASYSGPRSRNDEEHLSASISRRESNHTLPNTPGTPNMALEMADMRLTADHLLRDTLSPLDMAAFGETLKKIQRERAATVRKDAAATAAGKSILSG